MKQLITDELVQMAFDWLNQASDHIGAKRIGKMGAERGVRRAEERTKATFARLCRSLEGSVESRKWSATIHPDYEKAQAEQDKAEAELEVRTGEWESVMDQREKCKMIIEAWRTSSANERNMGNFR